MVPVAPYISGEDNLIADFLSRGKWLPREWALLPEVFNRLESVFSSPEIDLFASSLNHRLLHYCSRVWDLVAWALDTFSLHWKDLRGYAFPPFSLISQVLRKIKEDQASLILVAPCWPTRPWFSDVLTLPVDQPLPLPEAGPSGSTSVGNPTPSTSGPALNRLAVIGEVARS